MRRGAKPAKSKVEAKPPVARKARKSEGSRVQDLEKRLADALGQLQTRNRGLSEALEQQTATSEVLKVISRSVFDLQPVLETLLANAARLCSAEWGVIFRPDGEGYRGAVAYGASPEFKEFVARARIPPGRVSTVGRAALERRPVQIADVTADPEYQMTEFQSIGGFRTVLAVPMLREGILLGVFSLHRDEVQPFTDKQIELVTTFADQAVIAMENVRLFKELEARNRELTTALDTQTATSDILRVIGRSPTDVQPVFDAIVASAVRLLGAYTAALTRLADGQIELAALTSVDDAGDAAVRATFPHSIQSEGPYAQVMLDRAPLNVADAQTDPRWPDAARARARVRGYRSWAAVPLLRHDEGVGAISVARREPGGFTDDEIALLKTFADQAVIAIENVRLFNETKEALEQQMATSEVLKVISHSTFDLQPVLETLIENATRLCGADRGQVYRAEAEVLRSATAYGLAPEVEDYLEQRPLPIGPSSMAGRAALERRTIHSSDVLAETWFQPPDDRHKILGLRTVLAVPMLRGETVVGVFTIWKTTVEPFTDRQIELVTTFADQGVIAIENVRLFKELEARTRELTHSVEELRALGEVSQAVSSTLKLETVLATIVSRAVQMSGSYEGIVYEFDEATQTFHARATHQITPEHLEALRRTPVRLGEGAVGRAGVIREPVQVADIEAEWQLVAPQVRTLHAREGMRSLLAVPLVREDRLFGGLVILRRDRGAFSPEVVDTLRTLAAQSVLAIQNARLFEEIADKSRQLETVSRHKSEFLANMSHELRTPLNAVIGFSEVLLQRMFGALNEKQDEYLKDIYASGQHLLSLINDILDLSKVEAGRMELAPAPFHLPTALENAVTLVRERAARHGITLELDLDPRLGELVGDERKVKQVLLNLLSNAVKFTPEGGRITVKAGRTDEAVEIAVSDTGIGIAPEDQAAIFEEFRQVGSDETRKQEGTGLGLTLAKKFIELHGGRIWVESEMGRGSTFTFTLPVS